jgi:EAL domain-containing protein (putative c-di-GMP-specific phosphodiesterase class I)
MAYLKSQECDYGQGFFFARPLSAGAVDAFLRTTDPVELNAIT